jgi:hypothetical protein
VYAKTHFIKFIDLISSTSFVTTATARHWSQVTNRFPFSLSRQIIITIFFIDETYTGLLRCHRRYHWEIRATDSYRSMDNETTKQRHVHFRESWMVIFRSALQTKPGAVGSEQQTRIHFTRRRACDILIPVLLKPDTVIPVNGA